MFMSMFMLYGYDFQNKRLQSLFWLYNYDFSNNDLKPAGFFSGSAHYFFRHDRLMHELAAKN